MAIVAGVVGLVVLSGLLALVASIGRWLVVRSLGVRGVPFPFGAGPRWCWTTRSMTPLLLTLAGSLATMYLATGTVMALGLSMSGLSEADESDLHVQVEPMGPAAGAGVRDGDRVESAAGESVATWGALRRVIAAHAQTPVELVLSRDGAPVHVTVTPDSGGRIRVREPTRRRDASAAECARVLVLGPATLLLDSAASIVRTVAGGQPVELSGPVAIAKESGRQASTGPGALVAFLGALGAYLLPFLAIAAAFTGPGRRPRRTSSQH